MSNQKKKQAGVAAKPMPKEDLFQQFQKDHSQISPELESYFEANGLSYRWINFKRFRVDGFHKRGWVPFKREENTPVTPVEKLMGTRPDGFIVRGEDILAVKPSAEAEAYKSYVKEKNRMIEASLKKSGVEQLKSAFRDAGVKATIHEGYDDNE